jgi:BirA family biotin operon repressor/biotin-[acetyl-CoA-carboxylase] ligase
MIGDAKLGGILVESSRYSGDDLIIIGIGLNLAVAPDVPERKVTSLAAHGTCLAPGALLPELASTLRHWLAVWKGGLNFAQIREAWLDRAHPLGQALTVNALDQIYTGTFAGLGPDGSLSLRTSDGENVSLDHGDVSLVQQAESRQT